MLKSFGKVGTLLLTTVFLESDKTSGKYLEHETIVEFLHFLKKGQVKFLMIIRRGHALKVSQDILGN